MAVNITESIGFIAAATTTLCWFPQAWRTLRTRDTAGISLASQAAYAGGIALWAVYGLMIGSGPLIASNLVQLAPLLAVLWVKLANERAAR